MAATLLLPETEMPRKPPRQVNLFTGAVEVVPEQLALELPPVDMPAPEETAVSQSEDGSQLYVSGFGTMIGKKSERLVVKKAGRIVHQVPFFRLQHVTVGSRGVSFSSDLLEECCERGIRLAVLGGTGHPIALITSPMLTATVEGRRQQLLALLDQRGVEVARQMVTGKLGNQEKLLRYYAKHAREREGPDQPLLGAGRAAAIEALAAKIAGERRHAAAIEAGSIDAARSALMGIEGIAGRLYWQGVALTLEGHAEFRGRTHRGATDPVNAMLNYGYGMLYQQVWGAVLNAGLEPFAGFLHVDRPGKPSLVLDLTEEFRAPVVDRAVLGHFHLDQKVAMTNGLLDGETRRALAERIQSRFVSVESYRGKKYQVRSVIQMQARRLAAFLRGEDEYKPFSFKW